MNYPWALDFWKSGEWQVVNEKLHALEKRGIGINPSRDKMFEALRATSYRETKVCLLGQDPYPQRGYATGLAFSIPGDLGQAFPPTLKQVFQEYQDDLHYPLPHNGDLTPWARQGVLLWNAIPSCTEGLSLSHDFPGEEWSFLTSEIIRRLSERGICFAILGSIARRHLKDIDLEKNKVILTSHPSPRGQMNSKVPFKGSRIFSTINANLNELGFDPIDWRLKDDGYDPDRGQGSPGISRDPAVRNSGKVLENTTGAEIGSLPDARGVRVLL